MWERIFSDYTTYLLVFVRMSGMILFNPLFARRNMPTQLKMGFVLCLSVIIAPTVLGSNFGDLNGLEMVFAMLKELSIGFMCGMVFQIFYYMIFFAGDVIDTQFGLSMAKMFDPNTNIQMSITGNLFSVIFMVYIFLTDSHLVMIKIYASSYTVVPIGAANLVLSAMSTFIINLFLDVFLIVVKLAVPYVAVEFIVEASMGILMKLIPQIHVFVINIQFKLLVGILLLLTLAAPASNFLQNYMDMMFRTMQSVLYVFT